MTTALLVITDGRASYHTATMGSIDDNLHAFDHMVMVNDHDDPTWCRFLDIFWGDTFDVLHPRHGRRGFAGAIQAGWDRIVQLGADWVFHVEADFLFNESVNLKAMADVLACHPHIAQMALRRQPWNAEERKAGGIVEQHPTDYTDHTDALGRQWLEHRRFFTTNPSLYRGELCERGWPQVPHSEGIFTHQLLEDPAVTFGFWGPRDSRPKVHHVGDERAGHGY